MNKPKNQAEPFDPSSASSLARVGSGPLTEIKELNEAFTELEGQANLISPISRVDSIPALHAISLRGVKIDPKVDDKGNGTEVYMSPRFHKEGERSLGGVALHKIMAAAGVEIVEQKRLDDRCEPFYCAMDVTLRIRDLDGIYRKVTKAKEVDLRDGAPEASKKGGDPLDPSTLADRRRNIQSLTETKACFRALRALLHLKQKYTLTELDRLFIVPKLVAALDPSDPDQKQALIAMALGREDQLFGPQPGEPVRELRDVTPGELPAGIAVAEPTREESKPVADEAEGDFAPLEFPEVPVAVCSCPCGDQVELTEEVAKRTAELCGATRCRDCFPGRAFKVEQHRELADLDLPKHPGLQVSQIEAGLKAKR